MISGFTVENWKHLVLPREDYFEIDLKTQSAVVADGITRDPKEFLPDKDTFFWQTCLDCIVSETESCGEDF